MKALPRRYLKYPMCPQVLHVPSNTPCHTESLHPLPVILPSKPNTWIRQQTSGNRSGNRQALHGKRACAFAFPRSALRIAPRLGFHAVKTPGFHAVKTRGLQDARARVISRVGVRDFARVKRPASRARELTHVSPAFTRVSPRVARSLQALST